MFVELKINSTFVEVKNWTMQKSQLSNAEEQLMELLWKKKRSFMKDLIEDYPNPKPAQTTVATLLKRMQDKNYIGYEQKGRSREYFPLVAKKEYFSSHVNGLIKTFFNNSASQFASFFTKETNLSKEELEHLKSLIDQEINKK